MSAQFGAAVRAVLDEHGLTYRGAFNRTEIDPSTLWDMAHGKVPRPEKVVQFARGFALDVNSWLELAGYEPIWDADREFNELLREIIEEFDGRILLEANDLALRGKSPEEVRAMAIAVRERNHAMGRGKSARPAGTPRRRGGGPGGSPGGSEGLLLASRGH